jgi:CheY-like chemotaxis protein
MEACDVLVVEDDEATRDALKYALEEKGLLRQVMPKVILLDVLMPVMNGWRVVESIRQKKELASIPIIAVTGSASSMPLGCNRMLRKPTTPDIVMKAIAPYVGRKDWRV